MWFWRRQQMLACVMVGAIMAINLGGVEWMMKMEVWIPVLGVHFTIEM